MLCLWISPGIWNPWDHTRVHAWHFCSNGWEWKHYAQTADIIFNEKSRYCDSWLLVRSVRVWGWLRTNYVGFLFFLYIHLFSQHAPTFLSLITTRYLLISPHQTPQAKLQHGWPSGFQPDLCHCSLPPSTAHVALAASELFAGGNSGKS